MIFIPQTDAERLWEKLQDSTKSRDHVYFGLLAQESALARDERIVNWGETELRRLSLGGQDGWFGFIFNDRSILSHRDGYWIASILDDALRQF